MAVAYFLSDTHLGAKGADERAIVRWLDDIAADATDLYLLGDIMDFWWEYKTVVPRGFVRFLGALARLADKGVKITWLKGNHDIWMSDYLATEIGLRIIDKELVEQIDGHTFFMEHGDGVGNIPRGYRFMRGLFRNKVAQRAFATIHPRWAIALGRSWSSHSRESRGEETETALECCAPLLEFAKTHSASHPEIDHYIFGHYHCPLQTAVSDNGPMLTVLGSSLSKPSYARFADGTLTLYK